MRIPAPLKNTARALRTPEERKSKLAALRSHLAKGAAQAERGEFVTESLDEMLRKFREEQDDKLI